MRRLSRGRTIIMVCTVLFAAVCISLTRHFGNKTQEFELIYTTDVHGALLNYDFSHKNQETVSLSNVMTYLRKAREEKPGRVLLLDDGDLIQGDPSMYYYNYRAIRDEHLAARVFNYMGYDALNVGNHDFEGSELVYHDHLPKQMNATMLGANCIDSRTGRSMFNPYVVLYRAGYKIVVLGITNPSVPKWLPKSQYPHAEFVTMTESARQWIPKIHKQLKPDMLIVMFHAGMEEPEFIDHYGIPFIDGVKQIVAKTEGIDLVLIGHDHKCLVDKMVNQRGDSVMVVQPKSHGAQFASINFTLSPSPAGGTDVKIDDVTLQDSWRFPPDWEYDQTFRSSIDSVNHYLDTPLGTLATPLDGIGTLTHQTNLMDFIHEVQLARTNADISISSAINAYDIVPAGPITMRQLFSIYRHDNKLDKMWMTGRDVQRCLEYTYNNQFSQMHSAKDYLLHFILDSNGKPIMGNFGPELKTPQYNFTSAAGINYTVDVSKSYGHRVSIKSMADGTPFDPEHRYIVVLNSFQAAGGGGMITKGLGWSREDIEFHTVTESAKDIRYFMAKYIQEHQVIDPKPNGHWKVIPEEWWAANSQRDIDMLLPYIKR